MVLILQVSDAVIHSQILIKRDELRDFGPSV